MSYTSKEITNIPKKIYTRKYPKIERITYCKYLIYLDLWKC